LQKGDVIVAVNDRKIERTSDLRSATNVGRQVYWKLVIFRNGQMITSVIGG
jgi:S1-C subfamily serine protease